MNIESSQEDTHFAKPETKSLPFVLSLKGKAARGFLALGLLSTYLPFIQSPSARAESESTSLSVAGPENYLGSRIDYLNRQILENPENIIEYTSELTGIAHQMVSKELGVNPEQNKVSHNFVEQQTFRQKVSEITGCDHAQVNNRDLAIADPDNKSVFYNTDTLKKSSKSDPATTLLGVAIHEELHTFPVRRDANHSTVYNPYTGQAYEAEFIRGLVYYVPASDHDYQGRACYIPFGIAAEELLTEHRKNKTMADNGLIPNQGEYSRLTNKFDQEIIQGHPEPLYQTQMNSDPTEFYRLVKERESLLASNP